MSFEQIPKPFSFADLILTRAYPAWCQPSPPDNPTDHLKTYTILRGMAYVKDMLLDGLTSAALCHLSSKAPADALDELGATYGGLARALRDTVASYRAYLKGPMDRWYTFGTVRGLVAELAHLGYDARVVSWRDLVDAGAGAENVVFGGISSFFFAVLNWPASPFTLAPLDTWNGGKTWAQASTFWGMGPAATANHVDEIRRVIAMVKPAHTSCRFVVVGLDNTFALDAQLLPTGNFVTFPLNEPWERVRPSYAFNSFYSSSPLVP